jgi:hypothetical protein
LLNPLPVAPLPDPDPVAPVVPNPVDDPPVEPDPVDGPAVAAVTDPADVATPPEPGFERTPAPQAAAAREKRTRPRSLFMVGSGRSIL